MARKLLLSLAFAAAILLSGYLTTAPTNTVASTILESTDALEVVTSSTAGIDYTASYVDHTSSALTPGKSAGAISTATTTTIVSAPAASTYRQLKELTLRNTSTTASNTITLQRDVSATNRTMAKFTLAAGEWFAMDANGSLQFYSASGIPKAATTDATAGVSGYAYPYFKTVVSKDAAGYAVHMLGAAGFPGAAALQSPGLNGYTTDCSIGSQTTDPNGAAQLGSNILQNPSSGSLYMTHAAFSNAVIEAVYLTDIVWYNSGINVTTTTAQNITMPTLPSRDLNGSNNGAGWQAALLTTVANMNAFAIANTTISYTDQNGNAGNTGTFSGVAGWQAPATPVIWTWMPFQLAAGDTGIRSIQSITLGTSYGAGSLSLVLYRLVTVLPAQGAGVAYVNSFGPPGIRIWPGSCLGAVQVGSSSNATLSGSYTIVER